MKKLIFTVIVVPLLFCSCTVFELMRKTSKYEGKFVAGSIPTEIDTNAVYYKSDYFGPSGMDTVAMTQYYYYRFSENGRIYYANSIDELLTYQTVRSL